MAKPIVAIVGRPNVGKSTLFNRLARQRIAIVKEEPGVTRDRLYCDVEWTGHRFTVIDTGGIDTDSDPLTNAIRYQAEVAIEEAHVIVFVVDGQVGLTGADQQVAQILRQSQKPTLLCVNKMEHHETDPGAGFDFYRLGLGDPLLISAEHGRNTGDLLDHIVGLLPQTAVEEDQDSLCLAIVGRPNVGKSSLVNKILGQERVIVSDIAGTTRDSIDTSFEYDNQTVTLIDTAGMRRRSRVEAKLEYLTVLRALRSVERADVTIAVLDGTADITDQDKRIIGFSHEKGRGLVLAVNKWDLVQKETHTQRDYEQRLRSELAFVPYAPIVFISALHGKGIATLLKTAHMAAENRSFRISTGRLNELIQDATAMNEPPSDKGVRLKILFASQVQVNPPVIMLHINHKRLLHFSYQRYLENRLRQEYSFTGTPIIWVVKERAR